MAEDGTVAWHVSLAGRALSRTIEGELSEHGLGRGEYRVLFALSRQDGLTQTDLVERFHLEKSSVARAASRLQEKGYIEKRPDPADGRRKQLRLTPAGRALEDELTAIKERVESQLTDGLSDTEQDALIDTLRTICRNMDVNLEGTA